jgi:hypothetical protein
MAVKITNNAVSKLASGLAANGVTVTLTPGDGAKFPTLAAGDWFPLYLIKADGSYEICKATARAVDVITVVRAQENTAALTFVAGDRVELRLTSAAFEDRVGRDVLNALFTGVISKWAGAITDIPVGWKLCDGANGTPDLRGKFIVGAGSAGAQYAVGATGGADTVALTAAQMPAHNHAVYDPGHSHGVNDPGHNHGLNDPGHVHGAPGGSFVNMQGGGGNGLSGGGQNYTFPGTTNGAGTGIWLNAAATGIWLSGSGTGISTYNAGGNAAHENRPPYYALAYIQFKGI